MLQSFYAWSEANLGQWHYAIGYAIALASHNWPLILSLAGCACCGHRAFARPSRLWVSWLLTALLLGLAYEYQKHVEGELHRAIDQLFGRELAAWNWPLHQLVGPLGNTTLLLCLLGMLGRSIRESIICRGGGPQVPSPPASDKQAAKAP